MAEAKTATLAVEARINGGIYALNRFLMTLQNKRVPIAKLNVAADAEGTRATLVFDCPPQTASRYTGLLEALEDVQEIQTAEETIEIALVGTGSVNDWQESAARSGVTAHEDGGAIVASGKPEALEGWLSGMGFKDIVRLGPVALPKARPGKGG